LHESFESPVRHIDTPPFQVEEKGWGEFTIGMSISFHDASLKPVDVHHFLKLFPDQNSPQYALPVENRRPVVLEKYDELLFVDPTEDFNAALTAPLRALPANPLSQFCSFLAFNNGENRSCIDVLCFFFSFCSGSSKDRWAEEERRQLAQLSQVHDTVLRQIAKAKHDMRDLETENAAFREQLSVVSAIKATKK
jgi:hypothetical protein